MTHIGVALEYHRSNTGAIPCLVGLSKTLESGRGWGGIQGKRFGLTGRKVGVRLQTSLGVERRGFRTSRAWCISVPKGVAGPHKPLALMTGRPGTVPKWHTEAHLIPTLSPPYPHAS